MINNLSILFSLAAVGYVVLRAIMLDKMLPWFKGKESGLRAVRKPAARGKR